MVHKLWILDPKIKISPPFQTTILWSEFQTWLLNSMMLKSCLVSFKDSKKPPQKVEVDSTPSVPWQSNSVIIMKLHWKVSKNSLKVHFKIGSIKIHKFKTRICTHFQNLKLYKSVKCKTLFFSHTKNPFFLLKEKRQ